MLNLDVCGVQVTVVGTEQGEGIQGELVLVTIREPLVKSFLQLCQKESFWSSRSTQKSTKFMLYLKPSINNYEIRN